MFNLLVDEPIHAMIVWGITFTVLPFVIPTLS